MHGGLHRLLGLALLLLKPSEPGAYSVDDALPPEVCATSDKASCYVPPVEENTLILDPPWMYLDETRRAREITIAPVNGTFDIDAGLLENVECIYRYNGHSAVLQATSATSGQAVCPVPIQPLYPELAKIGTLEVWLWAIESIYSDPVVFAGPVCLQYLPRIGALANPPVLITDSTDEVDLTISKAALGVPEATDCVFDLAPGQWQLRRKLREAAFERPWRSPASAVLNVCATGDDDLPNASEVLPTVRCAGLSQLPAGSYLADILAPGGTYSFNDDAAPLEVLDRLSIDAVTPAVYPVSRHGLVLEVSISSTAYERLLEVANSVSQDVWCVFTSGSDVLARQVTFRQSGHLRCSTSAYLEVRAQEEVKLVLQVGDVVVSDEFALPSVHPQLPATITPPSTSYEDLDVIEIQLHGSAALLLPYLDTCRLGADIDGLALQVDATRIQCGPFPSIPGNASAEQLAGSWAVEVKALKYDLSWLVGAFWVDVSRPVVEPPKLEVSFVERIELNGTAPQSIKVFGSFPVPCVDCICLLDGIVLGPPQDVSDLSATCDLSDVAAMIATMETEQHDLLIAVNDSDDIGPTIASMAFTLNPVAPIWGPGCFALGPLGNCSFDDEETDDVLLTAEIEEASTDWSNAEMPTVLDMYPLQLPRIGGDYLVWQLSGLTPSWNGIDPRVGYQVSCMFLSPDAGDAGYSLDLLSASQMLEIVAQVTYGENGITTVSCLVPSLREVSYGLDVFLPVELKIDTGFRVPQAPRRVYVFDTPTLTAVQPTLAFTGLTQRFTLHGKFMMTVNYTAGWRNCPESVGTCVTQSSSMLECLLQACPTSGDSALQVYASPDGLTQALASQSHYLWPYPLPVAKDGVILTPEAPYIDIRLTSSEYSLEFLDATGLNSSTSSIVPIHCMLGRQMLEFTFTDNPFGVQCKVPVDPGAESATLSISVTYGGYPMPTSRPGDPEYLLSVEVLALGREAPRVLSAQPLQAVRGTAVLVTGSSFTQGLLCEFGDYRAVAYFIDSEHVDCPVPSRSTFGSGGDSSPLRLLWRSGHPTTLLNSSFQVQLRQRPIFHSFYPKVGVAGYGTEVQIRGQDFPEAAPYGNRSAIQCLLGPVHSKTDPLWTPAIQVSDTEIRCNVTYSVRSEVFVGVAFNGYLAGILPSTMHWTPLSDKVVWYEANFGITTVGGEVLDFQGVNPVGVRREVLETLELEDLCLDDENSSDCQEFSMSQVQASEPVDIQVVVLWCEVLVDGDVLQTLTAIEKEVGHYYCLTETLPESLVGSAQLQVRLVQDGLGPITINYGLTLEGPAATDDLAPTIPFNLDTDMSLIHVGICGQSAEGDTGCRLDVEPEAADAPAKARLPLPMTSVHPEAVPMIDGGATFTINFATNIDAAVVCRLWPAGTEVLTAKTGPRSVACASEVATTGSKVVQVSWYEDAYEWEPSISLDGGFHLNSSYFAVQVYFDPVITAVQPTEIFPDKAWTLVLYADSWPDASDLAGAFSCRVGGNNVVRGFDVPGAVIGDGTAQCNVTAEQLKVLGPGDHLVRPMANGVQSMYSGQEFYVKLYPYRPYIESIVLDNDILSFGIDLQNTQHHVLLEREEIIDFIENRTLSTNADILAAGTMLRMQGVWLPEEAECLFRPIREFEGEWQSTAAVVTNKEQLTCWLPPSVLLSEGVAFRLGTVGQVATIDATRYMEIPLLNDPERIVAVAAIDEGLYGSHTGLHIQEAPDWITLLEQSPELPQGREQAVVSDPPQSDSDLLMDDEEDEFEPDLLADEDPRLYPLLRGPWRLLNNDSAESATVQPGDRILFETNASQLQELEDLGVSVKCRVGPSVWPKHLEDNGWISCEIPTLPPALYYMALLYGDMENHRMYITIEELVEEALTTTSQTTSPRAVAVEIEDPPLCYEYFCPEGDQEAQELAAWLAREADREPPEAAPVITSLRFSFDVRRLLFSARGEVKQGAICSIEKLVLPVIFNTTAADFHYQYACDLGVVDVDIFNSVPPLSMILVQNGMESPPEEIPPAATWYAPQIRSFSPVRGSMLGGTTITVSVWVTHLQAPWSYWCIFGPHLVAPARPLEPWDEDEMQTIDAKLEAWVDLVCVTPRSPSPTVLQFWISTSADISWVPVPADACIFEYTAVPSVTKVNPDLVLHHFSRRQFVTFSLEALLREAHPAMSRRIRLIQALIGTVVTLRGRESGMFACVDNSTNSSGANASEFAQAEEEFDWLMDNESLPYTLSFPELSNWSSSGGGRRVRPCAEPTPFEVVEGEGGLIGLRTVDDGYAPEISRDDMPYFARLRGPVYCRNNDEVTQAVEVWEHSKLVAVRCPLSEDKVGPFATPTAEILATITNRTDCLPRWCTFNADNWKMALAADLPPSQKAARRYLDEDAPLYFDQGVPVTPARLLPSASTTRTPQEPALERPADDDYDLERRIQISFNGPDGDYVDTPNSAARAAQFRLPYEIGPLFGWADGGYLIFLRGIHWIPGEDMDYYLIFNFTAAFQDAMISGHLQSTFSGLLPVLCEKLGHEDAQCVVPAAPVDAQVEAVLSLGVRLQEEWYEYSLNDSFVDIGRAGDLQVRVKEAPVFTYVPVPVVVSAVPGEADHTRGIWLEVREGPYDIRIPHWCAWFPATSRDEVAVPGGRPTSVAQFVDETTLLCETPTTWAPAQVLLTVAMDASLQVIARGHIAVELYATIHNYTFESSGSLPSSTHEADNETNETAAIPPIVLDSIEWEWIGDLNDQNGSLLVGGRNFLDGCMCVIVDGAHWEPLQALRHPELFETFPAWANSTDDELRCTAPKYMAEQATLAIAVTCRPGVASENYVWLPAMPKPFLEAAGERTVHNNISEDRGLLLRGEGFASSSPVTCWSSHEPEDLFPATVLTDALAICHLPPAQFDNWDSIQVRLSTGSGVRTGPVDIPVEVAPEVTSLGQMVAYDVGLHTMEVRGTNLPVEELWCRFGELHTRLVVDEFSNQTRAICKVPPHAPGNTTMRVVSISHGIEFPAFHFEYRPQVHLHRLLPRSYIPYTETLGDQLQNVTIEGVNFIEGDNCTVYFGEFPSPLTQVDSSTVIRAAVPRIESNMTVKVHLFCTPDHLQANSQESLEFSFVNLPEVRSVAPTTIVLTRPQWVSLRGRNFEDSPNSTCRAGTMLRRGADVRFRHSGWVQCRLPMLRGVVMDLDMSYANDGIYFSADHVALTVQRRFNITSLAPLAVFTATVMPIMVFGQGFTNDVVCVFDGEVRVRPLELTADTLSCVVPSIFTEDIGNVSVDILFSEEQQPPPTQESMFLEIRPTPRFITSSPFFGGLGSETPVMLQGYNLDFDPVAMCIFSDGPISPATLNSTHLECLSVTPADGLPAVTEIYIRYGASPPYTQVKTGMKFRFAPVPIIADARPRRIWREKVLRVVGEHFDPALPMFCTYYGNSSDVEVQAHVLAETDLECEVPSELETGPVMLEVTLNHIEWSNPISLHIYGGETIMVQPTPVHVTGYGNETVRLSIPPQDFATSLERHPCYDDESEACLTGGSQVAPQNCTSYANMGLCGSSTAHDHCCQRSCGLCPGLLTADPPNLACLVDGWSLQPYRRIHEPGMLTWECAVPALPFGNHTLELVLLSEMFREAYPCSYVPFECSQSFGVGPGAEERPVLAAVRSTIYSWGGVGIPRPDEREAPIPYVPTPGGAVTVASGGVAAALVREQCQCAFYPHAVDLWEDDDDDSEEQNTTEETTPAPIMAPDDEEDDAEVDGPLPELISLSPPRGFRVGGTLITFETEMLEYEETLVCRFGLSVLDALDPAATGSENLQCRAPPCRFAFYLEGVVPEGVDECHGFVPVQMSLDGIHFFGDLIYEYVRMPSIHDISPFPGSSWNFPLLVTVHGQHFSWPYWCRWLDLPPTVAVDITPDQMKCTAPALPHERRPEDADFLQGYLEISPNILDWTRDRFQYLWYQEPIVSAVEPNITFHSYAPQGSLIVSGSHFRLLKADLINCHWLYDPSYPAEVTRGSLLSSTVMRCSPTAAPTPRDDDDDDGIGYTHSARGVELEVSMTTWVESISSYEVPLESRMRLIVPETDPDNPVEPESCMLTGGCLVTLRGNHLWPEDDETWTLYVAVGESLQEAWRGEDSDPHVAYFRLPPLPHMSEAPSRQALWLTRNLQDRTPEDTFYITYEPIPRGQYYSPELHDGVARSCPPGHYCPGVGANQSDWIASGEAPLPCPPGTFQNASDQFTCLRCPEGVQCQRPAMIEPEPCRPGYICWGATGYDANQAKCPAGVICIRPPNGKSIAISGRRLGFDDEMDDIVELSDVWEKVDGAETVARRLRLAEIPAIVEVQACPAGYFCPPGSIAQQSEDGTITVVTAFPCTELGILCTEGSFIPLATDSTALPGYYISEDKSTLIECPLGSYCPGGQDAARPLLCPPGQYQVTPGRPFCATCTAGTICPGFGLMVPELCPEGHVCSHPGRLIPSYLCPAGSWCVAGLITMNTQGNFTGAPSICPDGVYCMPGTVSPEVDDLSTTSARNCVEGTFCGANSTSAGGTSNCPVRWYCPRGVSIPQPSPPGHYVSESGQVYPSKCRPGTYAPFWLMLECLACPAGQQCELDGTITPIPCPAGTYRELTPVDQDPSQNVLCIACPQGRWSPDGGLTSVLSCLDCAERYACEIEGTTIFATLKQPCNASSGPRDICYENSQGVDCPQGYSCPVATAGFTMYDLPCEPGYWCKVRTIPSESRNLLCPAGYYCKLNSGESGGSGRKAFKCPLNHFCPAGTAAIDVRSPIDNQWVTQLYNVQSGWVSGTGIPDASGVKYDNHVVLPNEDTGAMCRQCPEDMEPEPAEDAETRQFDISLCDRCGHQLTVLEEEDEDAPASVTVCAPEVENESLPLWQPGLPCYREVEQWDVLECPVGTASQLQSEDPEDCMQVGMRIAVIDIYKCYPTRTRCRGAASFPSDFNCGAYPWLMLCNATSHLEDMRDDDTQKNSFLWMTPLSDHPDTLVYFLGYDPDLDVELDLDRKRTFYNITLRTMEMAILIFDFSNMNPTTRLNSGGEGHLDIHIHSSLLAESANQDLMETGHSLPAFFTRTKNARMHVPFQMKVLYIGAEPIEFSVQLDLRHGAHIAHLDTLNESLDITKFQPTFAEYGTTNFFVAIISREYLLEGDYELPYNMPPTVSGSRGEEFFVIDMRNTSGMENDPETIEYSGAEAVSEMQQAGTAFWGSSAVETVAMPWLPFFSNCEHFDSHIVIWELMEYPGGATGTEDFATRAGPNDECERYRPEDVRTVETMGFNFNTLEPAFDPIADNCQIVLNCRFEESLREQDISADAAWWGIEEDVDLFYITQNPVSSEDFLAGDDFFGAMQGSDSLISVGLENNGRNNRIPRKVLFEMKYYQKTPERKQMVTVLLEYSEFDDNTSDDGYQLMLIFEASSWQDLMNLFQLPYLVYGILYCIIGLGAVFFTVGGWIVIRLRSKVKTIPPWRFTECYEFLLWWPTQGVAIASVPIILVVSIIKISFLEDVNLISSIPCTYAGWNNNLLDASEVERCRLGRSGVCFMLTGLFSMYSASRMIIPRLREVEEQFLLQQPAQLLHREGLHLPVEQKSLIRSVPVRWKRGHLIFMSLMLAFPLMILWEFTYSDFFEAEPVYFIIGFNFGMIPVEAALSRSVREELIQVPLSTSCTVVLFIGTLGADDFADFCEGFFIELVIGVMDRLLLGHMFEWVGNTAKRCTNFFRTRSWFLSCLVGNINQHAAGVVLRKAFIATTEKAQNEEAEEEEEVEGTPIEEAMEEIIGCGTTCMSTIVAPYVILLIMFFGAETNIADGYGIREIDLVCYLLFGVMIAPFQVLMDIIMNHATEIGQGVKVYDYMLYAKWKWRNRLVRWLFDDPRMDQSIAEPLQSINHLCFSPQFYFIACYYTWGLMLFMIAITSLTRHGMNPFDDPMFFFVVLQMFVSNMLLDKIIRIMIFMLLWKPRDNTVARAFSRSVTWSMRRREANASQDRFRDWFMQKHAIYLVNQLGEIFTPRSREKYRGALSQLYQQLLELQPTHLYANPGPAFPDPKGLQELPPMLRAELMEEDDSSDSGEGEEEREERRQRAIVNAQEQQQKLGLTALPGLPGFQPPTLPQPTLPPLPALPAPTTQQALPPPPPGGGAQSLALMGFASSLPSQAPQAITAGQLYLSLPPVEPCPHDQEAHRAPSKKALAAIPWLLKTPDGSTPLEGTPGPLASYIGKAWLFTVRRQITMARLCRKWADEWQCETRCESCGVREDDPFAGQGVDQWDGKPLSLSVQEVKDIDELVTSFEDHYGVPPVAFEEVHWRYWLQRNEMFSTLCHRCIGERLAEGAPGAHRLVPNRVGRKTELNLPEGVHQETTQAAYTAHRRRRSDASGSGSSSRSDSASRSGSPTFGTADKRALQLTGSMSLTGSVSLPTPSSRPFMGNAEALLPQEDVNDEEVSVATKEMIMYWARLARRRVRAREAYE